MALHALGKLLGLSTKPTTPPPPKLETPSGQRFRKLLPIRCSGENRPISYQGIGRIDLRPNIPDDQLDLLGQLGIGRRFIHSVVLRKKLKDIISNELYLLEGLSFRESSLTATQTARIIMARYGLRGETTWIPGRFLSRPPEILDPTHIAAWLLIEQQRLSLEVSEVAQLAARLTCKSTGFQRVDAQQKIHEPRAERKVLEAIADNLPGIDKTQFVWIGGEIIMHEVEPFRAAWAEQEAYWQQ